VTFVHKVGRTSAKLIIVSNYGVAGVTVQSVYRREPLTPPFTGIIVEHLGHCNLILSS